MGYSDNSGEHVLPITQNSSPLTIPEMNFSASAIIICSRGLNKQLAVSGVDGENPKFTRVLLKSNYKFLIKKDLSIKGCKGSNCEN